MMAVDFTLNQNIGQGPKLCQSILQEIKARICKILKLTVVIKYSPAPCTFAPEGENADHWNTKLIPPPLKTSFWQKRHKIRQNTKPQM